MLDLLVVETETTIANEHLRQQISSPTTPSLHVPRGFGRWAMIDEAVQTPPQACNGESGGTLSPFFFCCRHRRSQERDSRFELFDIPGIAAV